MHPLYQSMPVSVFERMSLAAARHGAVNLGQGFPDFGWPPEILDHAARALTDGSNQYAPSRGLPALRQAVADHYARHHGWDVGADGICVTSGATEALAAAIFAVVEPGDEVIVLTPAYDAYAPLIRRAGGAVVEVPLDPPHWRIDRAALEAAITLRTRAIVLNNPQNPTGRLFDPEELNAVAAAAEAHDLIVIADEVWEHLLLAPPPSGAVASRSDDGGAEAFTPFATLPNMAARTIKTGSAGKIFSLTGWKIGWIAAAPKLAALAAKAHQFLTFTSAPNLQAACAFGLAEGDCWLAPMRASFTRARDRMTAGLEAAGFAVLPSAATYFLIVDLAASGIALDDEAFAKLAVEQAGVAVVPVSAFSDSGEPRHFVRLCFAKQDPTIDQGVAAMAKARALAC
ncbi:aminotransferase [Sphingomonas mesophila]|uniref:aminotransferase n=1 Tax=Sphingomonas mesophila TaxID=2303576 RepID=UPI000E581568|nr:aminotransferase [Sphingomonas mesophila]